MQIEIGMICSWITEFNSIQIVFRVFRIKKFSLLQHALGKKIVLGDPPNRVMKQPARICALKQLYQLSLKLVQLYTAKQECK